MARVDSKVDTKPRAQVDIVGNWNDFVDQSSLSHEHSRSKRNQFSIPAPVRTQYGPPGHSAQFRLDEELNKAVHNFGRSWDTPYRVLRWHNEDRKQPGRERLRKNLFASETHGEVLEILRQNNLGRHVKDYSAYLNWRKEDLDEGESPGIILQSLQSWAWFLVSYASPKKIPVAKLKADFDGCIELVWRLSSEPIQDDPDNEYWGNGRGIAVLKFFPSYLNSFSILSGPYASGKLRLAFEGSLSHVKTQRAIDMFAERLLNAGD